MGITIHTETMFPVKSDTHIYLDCINDVYRSIEREIFSSKSDAYFIPRIYNYCLLSSVIKPHTSNISYIYFVCTKRTKNYLFNFIAYP